MLRTRPQRSTFFAGTRRLQADLVAVPRPDLTEAQCAFLAAELERHGVLREDVPAPESAAPFYALVAALHAALLREAGFFYPESAEPIAPNEGSGLAVAIPKIVSGTDLAAELFRRLAALCARSAQRGAPIAAWIDGLRREIAKVPQPFLAAVHMVRAAHALGLPILEWHSVFLQVGYGRCGVALTGSITENTSSIGVHFAREKSKANSLLARAGFPIAEGALVKDAAEARALAERIGYPVVVKPADRDGGNAVSSDIRNPAELEQAFARARAASPRVMVEKHIDGSDFRMLIYRDELLVTLERTPGGVTGNGRDTVAGLLEAINAERQGTPILAIEFDDEAELMLRRQGLTAASVPDNGRFVPLRRAANHALGGSVRRRDDIHPDNVELARRAMRLLRLDLAGLDLILPDATRSWREAGGVICEVNAQPFVGEPVGRNYYEEILRQLVPDGGRIPLVLAIGGPDATTIAGLEAKLPGLAVIDGDGARRDGRPLSVAGLSWEQACQAALYDRETAAALCVLDSSRTLAGYSPADCFSAAFVLGELPDGAEHLLRRADELFALAPVNRKGLKFKTIQKADLAQTLAAKLSPAPATPEPARRGKAPPARRPRR